MDADTPRPRPPVRNRSVVPRAGRLSAGIVLYRRTAAGVLEVLLGHLGGPLFARRDAGTWTIPKGGLEPGESEVTAALRELTEETGIALGPQQTLLPLGRVRQMNGKQVVAWAVEHDADPDTLVSNTFFMPWPPKVGPLTEFRELDRFAWYDLEHAARQCIRGQEPLFSRLSEELDAGR